METHETLSVIIPAYNEEENIRRAAQAVFGILDAAGISSALYFVDDGSKDNTWAVISALSAENPRVRGVRFSRNFGKESAIFAGLEMAKGDCCAVMDCDLQHPPETLVKMFRLWQQGFEVIEGVKSSRGKESWLYKKMSQSFYRMMSSATRTDMSRASDFKLLDRKAVQAVVTLPERGTFFRALSSWVGYKTTCVEFEVAERAAGTTKWNKFSLVRYAVNNIVSFTSAPLYFIIFAGALFLLLAFVLAVESLVTYLTHRALEGFTTVILIQLISSSLIMISLGIIGVYISKVYAEVKGRHRYIISDLSGFEGDGTHDAV